MILNQDHWDVAHDVMDELVERFGAGEYHDDPPVLVMLYDTGSECYGWYEPGVIVVNLSACLTWLDVIGTLVHEYCHHLQDPDREDEPAYEAEADAFCERHMESLHQ